MEKKLCSLTEIFGYSYQNNKKKVVDEKNTAINNRMCNYTVYVYFYLNDEVICQNIKYCM